MRVWDRVRAQGLTEAGGGGDGVEGHSSGRAGIVADWALESTVVIPSWRLRRVMCRCRGPAPAPARGRSRDGLL